MSYALDFKKIAETPITDVVKMLGLVLTEKGDQLIGPCPVSQLMNPTAFKVTPSLNRFICFCAECKKLPKAGGDCIEMVRRYRRSDTRTAAQEIAKHFGAGKADDNAAAPSKASEPSPKSSGFDPLAFLASLDPAHEELTPIGVSPATLRAYKAGYCTKPSLRNRLAVAVCDSTGEIKAFVGVSLKGEALQIPKGYTLPYWWGIDHVREGQLWVLPTILDVLNAAENGETNVICPLAPTGPDALTSLKALMLDRNCMLAF